ncbi:MAG: GNAT family N-acetyltransferase [Thermoproteus sp.]
MAVDLRAYETYGAYLDGELVGFVALKFDDGLAEIVWMAVERKYQGRSIGTMLLDFVEEMARGRGARLIVVKTSGIRIANPMRRPGDSTRNVASCRCW